MRTRALPVVAAVLAALLVVLAVTGAWLTFNYGPWDQEPLRDLHKVAAYLVVATAAVGALLARFRFAVVAGALVAAFGVGLLLPWEQLALKAVIVRNDPLRGAIAAFDDNVRRVYVRDMVLGQRAYALALVAHAVALPAVVIARLLRRK